MSVFSILHHKVFTKKSLTVTGLVVVLLTVFLKANISSLTASEFLENSAYDFIFRVDFNNSTTDSVNDIVPTGSIVAYQDVDGEQVAQFRETTSNSGLSYSYPQAFHDALYDGDGFTVVSRYRVDEATAVSGYTGAVVEMWPTTEFPNNRSWGIVHPTTTDTTALVTSANGTSASFRTITPGMSSTLGDWVTVVVVYTGSQTRTYYGSDTAVTTTSETLFEPSNQVPLRVGYFNAVNSSMTGLIDYVYIMDSGMSQQDVTAFYASVEDAPEAPAQVAGLSGVSDDESVSLSWTAPNDNGSEITDYVIEYKLSAAGSWGVFDDEESAATEVVVTGLTTDEEYNFRVSAVNSIGTGVPSDPISVTVGEQELSELLAVDLVSHWKLDEATGQARIDSHGENDLAATGTAAASEGKIGTAFEPSGASGGGTLSVADNESISMGDHDFTIASWVNLDVATGTRGIAIKWGSTPFDYGLYATNGKFRFNTYTSTSNFIDDPDTIEAGQWYFVVGWYDAAADTVNIQVNNGDVTTGAAVGTPANGANPLTVGSWAASNYFDGKIDSVSLWKRKLTTQEITALYNNGAGLDYPFSAETPDPTAPGAPTGLSTTAGNEQVSLSWSSPADTGGSAITDYVVQYKLGTEPTTWTTFDDGVSVSTTTVVTNLTNDEAYDFRVYAVNSIGNSQASTTASATPQEASEPSSGSVIFEDDFTGTTIDTSKWSATGNATQNNQLSIIGSTAWATNMLATNETFSRENGDLSAEVTMTISDCSAGSPAMVYGGPNTSGSSVFAYYHLGTAILRSFTPNETYTTDFTCTDGVPFVMRLDLLQEGGAELYIDDVLEGTLSATTLSDEEFHLQSYTGTPTFDDFSITSLGVPETPTGLSAIAGDTQASLSWNDVDGNIIDYHITYKRSVDSTWETFDDGVGTDASAVVTGLTNGVLYQFRVSAESDLGTGVYSDPQSAMPVTAVGVAPSASDVSVSGFLSIDEELTGTYLYGDANGDVQGTSTFRWLSSDTENGTYEPISGATTTQYTPTENDLDKYIKFEVTPVSVVSPTTGSAVLSDAYGPIDESAFLNLIISSGQSLAIGRISTPALSTTQPFSNLMLSGAGVGATNETGGGGRGVVGTSLIPLVEIGQESIGSSMSNGIVHLLGDNDYQIAVLNNALGGTAYSGLQLNSARYDIGVEQLGKVAAAALELGKNVRAIGMTVIHGETDNLNGTTYQQYKQHLVDWREDYQEYIFDETGQVGSLPLFTDQMSTCSTPYSSGKTTCHIAAAQLDASEENVGEIFLVTPKYFFDYSDQHHLTNVSSRWLGEYYAKVMKQVIFDDVAWRPLSPDETTIDGDEIVVTFHVPAGELVFDTDMEPLKQNYGFEYADSTQSADIESVEIISDDTVRITLDGVPTGDNKRVRYAYTGVANSNGGTDGAPRGNLRDTDPALSQYGNTLYNWAVHFDRPLTDIGGPEEPTTYTLSYAAGDYGSIEGDVAQEVEADGSGTAVTAVASEGYQFMGWSDGVTNNPRTDADVNVNVAVTAEFSIVTGLDTDSSFLENLEYEYLFKADFSQNTQDSVSSSAPSGGSIDGYTALSNGYAAQFSEASNRGLNYSTSGDVFNGMYDDDGFSVVTRYRIDSQTAVSNYAGATASMWQTLGNNRSWGLFHRTNSNDSPFGYSPTGSAASFATLGTNTSATLGEWATAVVTYNGSTQIRTYLNGGTIIDSAAEAVFEPSTPIDLHIGHFDAVNSSMNGVIDYVYILDKGMTSTDVAAFFDTEPGEEPPPGDGELVELTNQSFVNSDGLSIRYSIYHMDNVAGPIAVVPDSWVSGVSSYASQARSMATTHGFIGLAIDTRGKGSSQGNQDAFGYECRDVYELVEHVKEQYAEYYDESQGNHMFGFSGGGGRSLICPGRYPDYFTSSWATGSVASLTGWYLANLDTSSTDRSQMRTRTGNSVDPGTALFYPTGGASAAGAVENQEAYTARDANYIGAYNYLGNLYLTHQTGDPRVPVELALSYKETWEANDKTGQDFTYFECNGSTHAQCDQSGGYSWMNAHKGVLSHPPSGNFRIGGWVETKRFKVEFLDDVGYIGDVDYAFDGDAFEFEIHTETYTGPTEVVVKNVTADNLVISDNDTVIGEITDGVLTNTNNEYDMSLTDGLLSLTLPSMSEHTVSGTVPEEPDEAGAEIANVSLDVSPTAATISWTTDEEVSSTVEYGLTTNYSDETASATENTATLSDLIACTIYAYRINTTDASENTSSSTGTFATRGCAGNSSVLTSKSEQVSATTSAEVVLTDQSFVLGVPENATDEDVIYQIKHMERHSIIGELDTPNALVSTTRLYDIKALSSTGDHVETFNNPLTLTVTYSDSDVAGIDESSLKLYRYHEGVWHELENCTVDTAANTVTCTTTHFSVFGLFGAAGGDSSSSESSGASSTASNSPSSCTAAKPDGIPDLFQIDTTSAEATLYFAPVHNVQKYFIFYGNGDRTDQYGVAVHANDTAGVLSYTIGALSDKTTYSFKIQAMNDCMPGEWSNTMQAATGTTQNYTSKHYKNVMTRITSVLPKSVMPADAASPALPKTEPVIETPIVQTPAPSPQSTPLPQGREKKCFLWLFCW